MKSQPHNVEQPGESALAIVDEFFCTLSVKEATRMTHTMIRAAFAQKDLLDKEDVLDLLFLKDELVKLVPAAEALAKQKAAGKALKKIFKKKTAGDWTEWLEELFHAAAYDGYFTNAPTNNDVYNSCRKLLKIIKECHSIHKMQEAAAETAAA